MNSNTLWGSIKDKMLFFYIVDLTLPNVAFLFDDFYFFECEFKRNMFLIHILNDIDIHIVFEWKKPPKKSITF